jgi:hypothetical protein
VLAFTARRWGWCSLRSRKFTALPRFDRSLEDEKHVPSLLLNTARR